MRKFSVVLMLALMGAPVASNADALGLFIGGGLWNNSASGTFGTAGDDIIDVETDLNFGSEQDTYVWAAFDHFVPLIPNIRVEAATIGQAGNAAGLDFNGVPVSGTAEVSLDNVDAILYYRLLDNWVNLDFGLNVRQLDGEFKIDTEILKISETIPMLYVAAQFDLPFSGFSVGGDINLVSYQGSSYQDIRLRAVYEIGVIAFEAGYKVTTVELDDVDNVTADLEFDGFTIGMFLHF